MNASSGLPRLGRSSGSGHDCGCPALRCACWESEWRARRAAVPVNSVCLGWRAGPADFAPGVCERVEPYLLQHLVGQDLAVRQLCDAVCDAVVTERPVRPLVLSIHGPPGVGKSLLHLLLARSLYSARPSADQRCPGPDCGGYKACTRCRPPRPGRPPPVRRLLWLCRAAPAHATPGG